MKIEGKGEAKVMEGEGRKELELNGKGNGRLLLLAQRAIKCQPYHVTPYYGRTWNLNLIISLVNLPLATSVPFSFPPPPVPASFT